MLNQKKSIVFFIGELGAGGAERVLIEILKHLNRNKYKLSLIVNRPGGFFYDKLPDDVTLIDRSIIRKSRYDLFDRIFGLPKIIKRQKADLVMAIMQGAGRSLMRSRYLIDRRVKLVVRIGNDPRNQLEKNHHFFWKRLERFETTHFISKADSVIAISNGIKEALKSKLRLKAGRIDVIYNPVHTENLQRMKKEDISGFHVPFDKKYKKLVAIGRLIPEKGYDVMIRVFQNIRSEIPCKLVIIGDGPLKPVLQKEIHRLNLQEEIILTGFLNNPWSHLHSADLYLSTSRSEGFHLSIVEAMACGVVPLATDCDFGPREIITDRLNGRLVPVGEVEAIASAAIDLLQNTPLRKEMAGHAKKRAQDFDISLIVKKYEEVLDELTDSSGVGEF